MIEMVKAVEFQVFFRVPYGVRIDVDSQNRMRSLAESSDGYYSSAGSDFEQALSLQNRQEFSKDCIAKVLWRKHAAMHEKSFP